VPVLTRAKKLVVIHDTIPEDHPDLALPDARSRMFWRVKSALARRQADFVLTVSEYSRVKIHQRFGIPIEQIHVVGEAADPAFRRLERRQVAGRLAELGIAADRRFIVYVGGFSPHKNVDRLVSVFSRIANEEGLDDVQLILVGEYENEVFNTDYPRIRQRVTESGLTARTVFTGYLPDDDLAAVLNAATVLVLPSLMEGFGLPAIEAAACGCPVIATRNSPLPDILDGGGIFVDPDDEGGLADAMVRVLRCEETRREMGRAAEEAARRFTWDESARQLLEVIDRIAGP
jgi:glycosyltransferase involved in cell wall biosynthesis